MRGVRFDIQGFGRLERHVGDSGERVLVGHDQVERRLEVGLVKAGEGASSENRLELGRPHEPAQENNIQFQFEIGVQFNVFSLCAHCNQ